MTEYTPTDGDMRKRHRYAWEQNAVFKHDGDEADAQFDRWIAAHDAQVRRDAARDALDALRRKELAMIPADAEEDHPVLVQKYALAWRIDMLIRSDYPEETP